jgi:hypothetical protein
VIEEKKAKDDIQGTFYKAETKANLSAKARNYLSKLGFPNPDTNKEIAELIWMHALAIGYSPSYLTGNASGVRQGWPRIPLPDSKEILKRSADSGRKIAILLNMELPSPGVTSGKIRDEIKIIGAITKTGGGALNPRAKELDLTAGWGHLGKDGVTMPGKGKIIERDYTPNELEAISQGVPELGLSFKQAMDHLGKTTCDVYLNDISFWKNLPIKVWEYTIGGYQVIKKWLSYRERDILGRGLTSDEAREVTNMVRRISAILLLEPTLDENYNAIKQLSYDWSALGEVSKGKNNLEVK